MDMGVCDYYVTPIIRHEIIGLQVIKHIDSIWDGKCQFYPSWEFLVESIGNYRLEEVARQAYL